MKYIIGNKDYLMHKKHKYTFKEWVNNSWRYFYDDALGIGSKKQLEEAKKNQASLKNEVDKQYALFNSMRNVKDNIWKDYRSKQNNQDYYDHVGKDVYNKKINDLWEHYKNVRNKTDNQQSKWRDAFFKDYDNDRIIEKETKDYEKSLLGKIDKGKKVISELLNKIKNLKNKKK